MQTLRFVENGAFGNLLLFTPLLKSAASTDHGNDGVGKAWKAKKRLPALPTRLGNPYGIPTLPRPRRCLLPSEFLPNEGGQLVAFIGIEADDDGAGWTLSEVG